MVIDVIGLALVGISIVVFLWAFYNIPIIVAGFHDLYKSRKKVQKSPSPSKLPTFLIVAPVKNEEKVIGRLLKALSNLNYPAYKKDVLVIEDGSTDKTLEICSSYAKEHPEMRILHRESSTGKSSALNCGIKQSKADIIAIFDADNIPDPNSLNAVVKYFEDPSVAAVQGKTLSINPRENI